ncbi:MAG: hypothetical protein PUC65_14775 [Clostridiales bacterium]|nr:hypothetical protein [Clostridiales bacterium]
MKKLINTCMAIQTASAVAAAISIIIMSSMYEPTIKAFLIMGVIFLTSIVIAGIMALIIDLAKEVEIKRQEESEPVDDDELPIVEVKEVCQQRSCNAVFCNYTKDGKYLYERGESDAKIS